jgi:hypothetical protein
MLSILGMHRSGTSCITGMVEEQGVFLGNVVQYIRDNPKGNRENRKIVRLHDDILRHNGSAWDNPPKGTISFTAAHKATRDLILKEYEGRSPCAFKDPRTLILLDFWKDMDLKYIGVIRNPLSVILSLEKRRQKVGKERGLELWKVYNNRLLDLKSKVNFPIINFDHKENLVAQVTEALEFYGILSDGAFTFLDPSLPENDAANWKDIINDIETIKIWEKLEG